MPAQATVGEFLKTFQELPPRRKPASFSIDQALEKARESEKQMSKAARRLVARSAERTRGRCAGGRNRRACP